MAEPALVRCPNCGKKNRVAVAASGIPRCGNCHQPLPWIVNTDGAGFDTAIEATIPVLVDFWAPWCAPCRMVTPAVESVATTNAGRVKLVKLNVDDAPDVSERYGVRGIPLLVVIEGGREVDRLAGAAPEPHLREWLERHIAAPAT